jgi:hypothetical protein
MSEAKKREIVQKIDEVIEGLENIVQLLRLKQMKLQIKIARAKAEARAKSERPQGE